MVHPENALYIIQGEVNMAITAMRQTFQLTARSSQDPLISSFYQLRDLLTTISDISELAPNDFLRPFLGVIRSEDTTGPITGLALTSVNKFLSYGFIDHSSDGVAAAIENIAEAVTHARFVGTDPSSDEVFLMKILHVLRTLLLTEAGTLLTNESVCEIMQSCFRICFEMRLSELLRKSAEHTLNEMVQLLFSRLPQFKEDTKWARLKMRAGGMEGTRGGRSKRKSPRTKRRKGGPTSTMQLQETPPVEEEQQTGQTDGGQTAVVESGVSETDASAPDSLPILASLEDDGPMEEMLEATTPVSSGKTVIDIHEGFKDAIIKPPETGDSVEPSETAAVSGETSMDIQESEVEPQPATELSKVCTLPVPETVHSVAEDGPGDGDKGSTASEVCEEVESVASTTEQSDTASVQEEYVNPRGIRFTPSTQGGKDGSSPMIPHGLPCVRELFRFLISLTNPLDRHNTDTMIHIGLSLLTVALESGADHVASFSSLLCLVKDDMCKNLFYLLKSERLGLFPTSMRVCFLVFESMRTHLKFQLEMFFGMLMDIIVSESPRISLEQREITLETIVQLLRIPGLVTELYLNYDCDLYCRIIFDDLMKLLSKNAFPVSGIYSTQLLSLDALLAVIYGVEQRCHHRILNSSSLTSGKMTLAPQTAPQVKIENTNGEKEENEPKPESVSTSVPRPPFCGYTVSSNKPPGSKQGDSAMEGKQKVRDGKSSPQIRPNRMKISSYIPAEEELAAIKHKKKLYETGTEHFNVKPAKGIAFLQEHGLLSNPVEPHEVVKFLKENPRLDKAMIGEYISNKKNIKALDAFQKSFNFEDTRIDEAVRMYLETFRLPGEAPVISYILEHFTEHWHKTNGEPFANHDAAFTLAYAVIMLNVDQHNTNAKKQNKPMTHEEFKRNISKVNGGEDFDHDMLDEIYNCVKNDEIVMPDEHAGLVKENYLWKVLLRRGASKEGNFIHAPTGAFDRDLFSLLWGPAVAALSFVFDKSMDEAIIQNTISGFRKCAMIAAHYGISNVFDNLVISLCKFTTLLSSPEEKWESNGSVEKIPVLFGNNTKAQLAAKTVFGLAHRHGDILREGWKNILDCMLQLYRAKLLPEALVTVEDFLDPTGRITLVREDTSASQRTDTGVLSSFYSYFALSEASQPKYPTPEEQEAIQKANRCLLECRLDNLIVETKFLQMASLQELVKALIFASRPEMHDTVTGNQCDEDAAVFCLELLVKVVLQNRDRISPFWQLVRDHIYNLVVNATEPTFLVERAVVGLLRLAVRLLRRDEIAAQVLDSLRILLMMKASVIHSISRQVAFGLHELLKTNAANIHSTHDWNTLFSLLEVVGAGTNPPPLRHVASEISSPGSTDSGAQSDSEVTTTQTVTSESGDRGYTSDSELYEAQKQCKSNIEVKPAPDPDSSWLLCDEAEKVRMQAVNQYNIALNEDLKYHDVRSLIKSCETLAFLVRDAAHVTPHNFESCVHCIRTFVEASINGGHMLKEEKHASPRDRRALRKQRREESRMRKSKSTPTELSNPNDSDDERESDSYHSLSIQLLDLMHTLHTRAATIFSSWAAEEKSTDEQIENGPSSYDAAASSLWTTCWCPLLQGIARLCCDSRRHVRSQALTYLQRALLVHDLQTLSAVEWENCFNKVLFPLLHKLLGNISPQDLNGIEETRMRASALLCKVFLQHLTPLLSLSTFTALWLTILEFMDKYMHTDKSDLLWESIPESLKNMLLVMRTAGILTNESAEESQLWSLTWDRIDSFLPHLREEVFKPHEIKQKEPEREATPVQTTQPLPSQSPSPPPQPPTQSPPPTEATQPAQPVQPAQPAQPDTSAAAKDTEVAKRESALTAASVVSSHGSYILHPPLPLVASPRAGTGLSQPMASIPLLLDPDVMQSTAITVISPQGTPERKPVVTAEAP